MSGSADDKMDSTGPPAAAAETPNLVDELFLCYRLKVGRTCFTMLLSTQIVYHIVYVVLRRSLDTEVGHFTADYRGFQFDSIQFISKAWLARSKSVSK